MKTTMLCTATLLLAMSACSTPISSQRLASSEASVKATIAVMRPSTSPEVAEHLRQAEENMVQARYFIGMDQPARAELFLQRARADAELALSLVIEEDASDDANRARTAFVTMNGAQ